MCAFSRAADGRNALGALAPEHPKGVGPAGRALAAERQCIAPAEGAFSAHANQDVGSAQRPLGAPQTGLVQVLLAGQGVAAAEGRAVVLDPVGHTGATTRAAHTTSQTQAERRFAAQRAGRDFCWSEPQSCPVGVLRV